MSLLNKFSSVEIKADNRISEGDKAFCLRHQEAFDRSGPVLQEIADLMQTGEDEQRKILSIDEKHFFNPYMSGEGVGCEMNRVYAMMEKRNSHFIHAIVSHFSDSYNVELDEQKITQHLIPDEPKAPYSPWGGYQWMSEEEIAAYEEAQAIYKEEKEKYTLAIRTLPLRYEQIVDEIFAQLGGFSFQERAMNEFLERTWECCHQIGGDQDECFEIKNDTLRLIGHWCSCDDSWTQESYWKASGDLKTLLEALAWFECGRLNEGHLWFKELFCYSTKSNEFDIYNMEKIKRIKLYKNGRTDIKFRSAAYAQEFVEQCMRRKIS